MTTATEVKERPILFSAPMVRAILDGTKTMKRRKMPTPFGFEPERFELRDGVLHAIVGGVATACVEGTGRLARCPYGEPGDHLWVRETWAYFGGDEYLYQQSPGAVAYRADEDLVDPPGGRWRPSIFMPRWASRLTLEITDVRVERLQAITEADAIAEGVDAVSLADVPRNATTSHRADFAQLWDLINGKRPGCAWADNPWVWVIAFRRVE